MSLVLCLSEAYSALTSLSCFEHIFFMRTFALLSHRQVSSESLSSLMTTRRCRSFLE